MEGLYDPGCGAKKSPKPANEVITQASAIMNSVVNPSVPNIPLIFRSGIITLCAIAAWDSEVALDLGNPVSWENASQEARDEYLKATEESIKKFCELEGIKQEFKGNKYRLISQWREV